MSRSPVPLLVVPADTDVQAKVGQPYQFTPDRQSVRSAICAVASQQEILLQRRLLGPRALHLRATRPARVACVGSRNRRAHGDAVKSRELGHLHQNHRTIRNKFHHNLSPDRRKLDSTDTHSSYFQFPCWPPNQFCNTSPTERPRLTTRRHDVNTPTPTTYKPPLDQPSATHPNPSQNPFLPQSAFLNT